MADKVFKGVKDRSFIDQYIVRPRKPQKFATKVTKYRFARDEKGVLGVVPNGEKDWYLEAQSHAKEVGFENLVHHLPDGRVVISSNTSSGVGFFGDATLISDEPNQAIKDLDNIKAKAVKADSDLKEKFGDNDYLNISKQELSKLIADYVAKQGGDVGKDGNKDGN